VRQPLCTCFVAARSHEDPASQLGFESEEVTFDVGYRGPACEPTAFHWLERKTNSPPGSAGPFLVTDSPELHLPGLTFDQSATIP